MITSTRQFLEFKNSENSNLIIDECDLYKYSNLYKYYQENISEFKDICGVSDINRPLTQIYDQLYKYNLTSVIGQMIDGSTSREQQIIFVNAVNTNCCEIVSQLLSAGYDTNHVIEMHHDREFIDFVSSKYVSLKYSDEFNALGYAMYMDKIDIVEMIINHGAEFISSKILTHVSTNLFDIIFNYYLTTIAYGELYYICWDIISCY